MTTYYVDSVHGSDTNGGQAEGQAFKTIAALSQATLRPGDNILLARGSTFNETLKLNKSGKEGAPITVAAYGTGDAPKFSGDIGIYATKTSYITVKDIAFHQTTGAAIYGNSVNNWTIDNVSFIDTGKLSGIGGVFFKTGSNVSLTNSTFDGIAGDGLFVMNINGLTVSNNSFTRLHGAAADAIQFTDSQNVTVTGNKIDQSTSPDSTKGGIVGNNVENVVLKGNDVVGGGFGMGINGQHVVIEGNQFSGHTKYGWSASVLVGGDYVTSDYVIKSNTFSDSRFGVSLTGLRDDTVSRTDIKITDNVFQNMERSALKIDKPSTGEFTNNVIVNSELLVAKGEGESSAKIVGQNLTLSSSEAEIYFSPKAPAPVSEAPVKTVDPVKHIDNVNPVAVNDLMKMGGSASTLTGNVLANDFDADGDTLAIRSVGSQKMTNGGIELAGSYGTLTIKADGHYSYQLYDTGTAVVQSGKMVDKFQYKMSDGYAQDTAALIIDVSNHITHHADGIFIL